MCVDVCVPVSVAFWLLWGHGGLCVGRWMSVDMSVLGHVCVCVGAPGLLSPFSTHCPQHPLPIFPLLIFFPRLPSPRPPPPLLLPTTSLLLCNRGPRMLLVQRTPEGGPGKGAGGLC